MLSVDNLPLWAFFVVVFLISLFWGEAGYRVGEWRLKKSQEDSPAPLGTIVGSILGLLAFMLAFTFNVALSRFDDRRVAVLTEANAIGTTYLRADFFDEPQQSEIKKLLREYVQIRREGINAGAAEQVISRSEALQDQLWKTAATAARQQTNSTICPLFISSLNDVIDMHSKRVVLAFHARVPLSVWIVLFLVSTLSMLGVGYYCGMTGNRSRAENYILIATFSIVMLLVADLDRPYEGLIQTNQQAMLELHKKLGPP